MIGESYLGFQTVLKDREGFNGFIFCPVFRSELFPLISVHFGAGARQFQVVSAISVKAEPFTCGHVALSIAGGCSSC